MRILVADDSMFMRRIQAVLESSGYQVIGEASNGLEALKEILNYNPHAKVLMCSAMGQESIIKESIEYGAKGFITKPLRNYYLMELQRFLENVGATGRNSRKLVEFLNVCNLGF